MMNATRTICADSCRLPVAPGTAASRESMSDVGAFLVTYTSWLWGCGATCARIRRNVGRIAAAYGYGIDLTVMPRHVTVALAPLDGGATEIFTGNMRATAINFSINAKLSSLSWNMADCRLSVAEATSRLNNIVSHHYTSGLSTFLLVSLANASFCRLFGGDAAAMAIVFVSTFAGCFLKQILLDRHVDNRIVFMICAFVSMVLTAGALTFGWSSTPDVALATSVLYLIPGVPYINSASDFISRHYICSLNRFADAVVLTAAITAGMCLGLSVMNLEMLGSI